MSYLASKSWFAICSAAAFLAAPTLAGEPRICVINIDGTGFRQLVDLPGYVFQGSPSWSHDGKQIAFDASPGGPQNGKIFVVDAAGGGEPRDLGFGSQPSWSADDKQLCFFVLPQSPSGEKQGVYIMNSEGKARQYLAEGFQARWSNDGGKIAYRNYGGPTNIFVYSILDAESTPLLKQQIPQISPPTWSEDGKHLCFISRTKNNGPCELNLIETEGDHKLTSRSIEGMSFVSPSWAPGKFVVFGIGGARTSQPHWLDPLKDSEPTKIDGMFTNFWDPCWAPDGKQIAFRCDQ
jgi:Tol biopolymer transport system component